MGGRDGLSDANFNKISKNLPVIARNHLENGVSENLWYEEVVPRESVFYTVLQFPQEHQLAYQALRTKDDSGNDIKRWDKEVKEYFERFQGFLNGVEYYMGANTTVGYGLCHIKERANNIPIVTPTEEEASNG